MVFFTGKGDDGKTGRFGCDQRISKSSAIAEALGCVDEINSFLGVCKVKADGFDVAGREIRGLISDIQNDLFVIQAELGGYSKLKIGEEKVKKLEEYVNWIERELPPIKTFFVAGGTELSALFDYARAVVRRAERRAVLVSEQSPEDFNPNILAYLNRLSSILYALARFANFKAGVPEEPPRY
ncbi:MAG: cob(I)yrinic acid a,c-diamide adenosyltransferase [Candidatus Niyogibacteria bacterium]|nr:MAG: cob(I)yrinic acid a,c-diamide adenosyltransferase [Candidatus Niyogibacteria bacterium]